MSSPARTSTATEPIGALGGRLLRWALAAAAVGVLLGVTLHLATARRPAPAPLTLPAFHGQAQWPEGRRRAPDFALRDQDGRLVSIAAAHRPVMLAFLSTRPGGGSAAEGAALAQTLALLSPAQRPVVDIVSLDPAADTAAHVSAAAAAWGLARDYHWLSGAAGALAAVWRAYGAIAPRDPRVYLVDPRGYERVGYLYPFFPTVVARDLQTLAGAS